MKKIRVCNSRSCEAFGAKEIMRTIADANEDYDLDYCGCLGWCSNSPNVEINDQCVIMDCDPKTVMDRIQKGDGKDNKR